MNPFELIAEYRDILAKLPDKCRDRASVFSKRNGQPTPLTTEEMKIVEEADQDLAYLLKKLRRDDRRFKNVSWGSMLGHKGTGDGLIIAAKRSGEEQHLAFLQSYVGMFEEMLPDIRPDLKTIAQLLAKQAGKRKSDAILALEQELAPHLLHINKVINDRYRNQLAILTHREASGQLQERYVSAGTDDPLWIFVVITAAILVFMETALEILQAHEQAEKQRVPAPALRWRLAHLEDIGFRARLNNEAAYRWYVLAANVLVDHLNKEAYNKDEFQELINAMQHEPSVPGQLSRYWESLFSGNTIWIFINLLWNYAGTETESPPAADNTITVMPTTIIFRQVRMPSGKTYDIEWERVDKLSDWDRGTQDELITRFAANGRQLPSMEEYAACILAAFTSSKYGNAEQKAAADEFKKLLHTVLPGFSGFGNKLVTSTRVVYKQKAPDNVIQNYGASDARELRGSLVAKSENMYVFGGDAPLDGDSREATFLLTGYKPDSKLIAAFEWAFDYGPIDILMHGGSREWLRDRSDPYAYPPKKQEGGQVGIVMLGTDQNSRESITSSRIRVGIHADQEPTYKWYGLSIRKRET